MTRPRRRLLVVEDEPLMASLLAQVLAQAGFEVRTASDAAAAHRAVEAFDPDVALLDIELGPGPSGLDLGHVLQVRRPDVALVFLTRHADGGTVALGVEVPPGAGFLYKDRVTDTHYLLAALEEVLAEQAARVRHDLAAATPLSPLTPQQLAVLRLAAAGWSNEAIARQRGTSARAVQLLLRTIAERLGVEPQEGLDLRTEVVRRYIASAGLPGR